MISTTSPTTSYDGDEPMYESSDDDTDYEYSDNDTDYEYSNSDNYCENSGGGGDGCADFGCLIIIIFIVYALFKCCN